MSNPAFEECLARCAEQSRRERRVYLPVGCEIVNITGGIVRYTIRGFHPGTIYDTGYELDREEKLECQNEADGPPIFSTQEFLAFKSHARFLGAINLMASIPPITSRSEKETPASQDLDYLF